MSNNVIYAKRIVPRLNRFYSGYFQNITNFKTFFGYAYGTGFTTTENRLGLITVGSRGLSLYAVQVNRDNPIMKD